MIDVEALLDSKSDTHALGDQLRRAKLWAWIVFNNRVLGVSRDLAWTLIALVRDHDPANYSPWFKVEALEPVKLAQALDVATEIARLIRKADRLQPHLVRDGRAGQ